MLDYDLTRAEQVRRTDLAQKARRMILSHMKVEAEDETSLTLDHRGYLGKYVITEKQAPHGMALQTEPHTVELVYAGQEVTVTELRADMYNEIDTDGKTYTVENEAGKGFINHALKGSLKIIKTTSDGKKEGFAFRITGANGYDMTFTTDAKGEIFIEKLRIGEYTVTELKNSASEGYKIADPVKITLVANETLTVKIHNDKTKVDVPKTGDDADLILWISLLGLAAAGAGCTAFFYLKKRRTSKHIAAKK